MLMHVYANINVKLVNLDEDNPKTTIFNSYYNKFSGFFDCTTLPLISTF